MKADKITAYIYTAVSVLSVLCVLVTNTGYQHIVSGLVYMWVCYFCFWMGIHAAGKTNMIYPLICARNETFLFEKHRVLVMSAAVTGMVLVAGFYTGQTPWSVLAALQKHQSLYAQYQTYFQEMSLDRISLLKIPYILINAGVQFVLVYCFIYIMLIRKKMKIGDMLFLMVLAFSKLYSGIARGTNFEMFEMAFLCIYCYLSRPADGFIRIKRTIAAAVGIACCCMVFIFVIRLRGGGGTSVVISRGIVTDSSRMLTAQYPQLAMLIAYLSAYFCFGIYYLTYFFKHFLTKNIFYFLNGVIPYGYMAGRIETPDLVNTDFLRSVCWKPDLIRLIYCCGILAAPVLFFVFGRLIRRIQKVKHLYKNDIYICMLEYFIVYQLFSFPIGNFILVTSASRLALLLLIVILSARGRVRRA